MDSLRKILAHREGRTRSLQITAYCKSLTLYPIELGGHCDEIDLVKYDMKGQSPASKRTTALVYPISAESAKITRNYTKTNITGLPGTNISTT
jgi:hypothetical protein